MEYLSSYGEFMKSVMEGLTKIVEANAWCVYVYVYLLFRLFYVSIFDIYLRRYK